MTAFCCSAMLVVTMLLAGSAQAAVGSSTGGDELRVALCYPGTGMCRVSSAQASGLAAAVDRQMRARSGDRQTLADFVGVVRALRVTGTCRTLRVFPGGRTLRDVCRELGSLVVRQQELERGGRSDEVAGTLRRLRVARESGAAEGDVQRLARAALERGDLMVRPGAERRQVSARMEQAVGRLVAGEQVVATRALSEGVPPREFLSRASEFDARGLQVSAK